MAIVYDQYEARPPGGYVEYLIPGWEAMGFRVIRNYGPRLPEPVDIAVLHVDKTMVPSEYVEGVAHVPTVINRDVTDISRPTYSNRLLDQNDAYDGQVIIKTCANFGGVPELVGKIRSRTLSLHSTAVEWRLRKRARLVVEKFKPWRRRVFIDPYKYPILGSKQDVPRGVWKNPHLVVEKFMPEIEDGLYFKRYWLFLGDKEFAGRFGAKGPVVKFGRAVTTDQPVPVPQELRAMREKLRVDFGRFDFAIHNGEIVLFDVNITPGGTPDLLDHREELDDFATGIRALV
jgi:hypothetical protein